MVVLEVLRHNYELKKRNFKLRFFSAINFLIVLIIFLID